MTQQPADSCSLKCKFRQYLHLFHHNVRSFNWFITHFWWLCYECSEQIYLISCDYSNFRSIYFRFRSIYYQFGSIYFEFRLIYLEFWLIYLKFCLIYSKLSARCIDLCIGVIEKLITIKRLWEYSAWISIVSSYLYVQIQGNSPLMNPNHGFHESLRILPSFQTRMGYRTSATAFACCKSTAKIAVFIQMWSIKNRI